MRKSLTSTPTVRYRPFASAPTVDGNSSIRMCQPNAAAKKKWVERELATSAEDLHDALLVLFLVARSSRGTVDRIYGGGSEEQGSPVWQKNIRVEVFFFSFRADLQRGHRARSNQTAQTSCVRRMFHFTEAFRHGAIAVALSHGSGTVPPAASLCSEHLCRSPYSRLTGVESFSCFKRNAFLSLFSLSGALFPMSNLPASFGHRAGGSLYHQRTGDRLFRMKKGGSTASKHGRVVCRMQLCIASAVFPNTTFKGCLSLEENYRTEGILG